MPDINMQVFEEAQRNQLVTEVDIQTQVALDDYQVQLSDIANPTQSQDNVVIDRNGEFLPHWNESLDFDTWVKMSMEVAGKQVLMLRGNSSVSNVSDGDNTFIQYKGATTDQYLLALEIDPTEFKYEAKVKVLTESGSGVRISNFWGLCDINNDDVSDYISIDSRTDNNTRRLITANDGTGTLSAETPKFTVGNWYKLLIVKTSTNAHGYMDSNEIGAGASNNFPNVDLGLWWREQEGTGEQKYAFVHQYTATEPTWVTDGEQNIAVALKSLGRAG